MFKYCTLKRNKVVQFVLDVLFPSFCVGCGKEGIFLCGECRKQIVIKRVAQTPDGKSPIRKIYAAADYSNRLISELITKFKFQSVSDIRYPLTDMLIEHLTLVKFRMPPKCVMTAVPLHKQREIKRGFNQAELIAREVAGHFQIPYREKILKRTRNTDPQTEMENYNRRMQNVKESFVCNNQKNIAGKRVIIVDDVTTTGATLNECAKALKSAGARSVTAFVVAR